VSDKHNQRRRLRKAKVKRITDRRIGNQAAYEQQLSLELCDDLAREFSTRSGGGRANYNAIALELVSLRPVAGSKRCSLVMLLRDMYETNGLLRDFLRKWEQHICNYISACIDREDYPLNTHGCVIDADLMRPLAKEYMRDRKTLMLSLSGFQAVARNLCF
jgi:hypothetical protein